MLPRWVSAQGREQRRRPGSARSPRVTVRWHPASRGDDRTQDPEQCQGTTPTDDGTLRVALASAVAQACGGRLRILGGEHTTDVSIELDLPRRAGPRDG